jgi:glycopeptide antibiotics resistance protein
MHKLFIYIYCQPLPRLTLFIFLFIVLWGYLGYRERNSLRWRLVNAIVFLGIVAVAFYMTVYTRGESAEQAVFTPFQSFQDAKIQPELYRSMLMNVFLFVPVGISFPFVLGWRRCSCIFTVILAALFSAGIEYLQYRYALGKCEVDDVIMNTLGALMGCIAYWLFRYLKHHTKKPPRESEDH